MYPISSIIAIRDFAVQTLVFILKEIYTSFLSWSILHSDMMAWVFTHLRTHYSCIHLYTIIHTSTHTWNNSWLGRTPFPAGYFWLRSRRSWGQPRCAFQLRTQKFTSYAIFVRGLVSMLLLMEEHINLSPFLWNAEAVVISGPHIVPVQGPHNSCMNETSLYLYLLCLILWYSNESSSCILQLPYQAYEPQKSSRKSLYLNYVPLWHVRVIGNNNSWIKTCCCIEIHGEI